jgi:C-terminal processing protease CtpA/Prc
VKKYTITACLLVLISLSGSGQTFDTTARVKTFIKIWGFLKYYHPLVATGNIDWDSVFVNTIQGVVNSKNSTDFNNKIFNVINTVGKAPKVLQLKEFDSLFVMNRTNINWITTSTILNNQIKNDLRYINDNKNQDTNKYIKRIYKTVDFSGEKRYDSIGFPDMRYRLLFLSRFWNIINYFAPYKYLTTNWDDVLEKFTPKIINSKDSLSYYKSLQELCKSLNDGHSQLTLSGQKNLTDLIFGNYTVPFYCTIINGKVVIRDASSDSMAKTLNIQQGDIIMKANGEEVSNIINNRRKYISASNFADEMHQLSWFVLDGQTPTITLEIKRKNKLIKIDIVRVSTSVRDWGKFINYTGNDVGYKKINDSILLIYAMQIWNGNIDTIIHLIKQSKAIIFDVRNYPQNDAFYSITDAFLHEPKYINYLTVALPDFPSLFQWVLNPNKVGHINNNAYRGKVIVLCDERTESQGEYSCMVLQTISGSVTIGSQTAGGDGLRKEVPMGGGLSMSYSTYGVYYPDKTQTQRVGVKINIPVKKTIEAIQSNKDEILERALLYIKNGK